MHHGRLAATALSQLGRSPLQVVASLREAGVRGRRNALGPANPVVRFLREQIPGEIELHVIEGTELQLLYPNGRQVTIRLPVGVEDFLVGFNFGFYPDLVEAAPVRR